VSRWRARYYLLCCSGVILYLPAILSYDRVPVFHRAQGAVPAIAMLVAVGALAVWRWLAGRVIRRPAHAFVPIVVVLLVSGALTAYDYFVGWAPEWYAYKGTQPYVMDLIREMNSNTADKAVYLFPYDNRNGKFEHPSLQLFYRRCLYISILTMKKDVAQLTQAVAGREVVRVVDWKHGRSLEADPKRWIAGLLTMYGQPLGITAETEAFRIESFRLLTPHPNFQVMPPMQSLEKPPAGALTLRAFAFGPTGQTKMQVGNPLRAGSYGWVLLKWSVANPTPLDYKVSVRLLANGTVVAQNDKVLLNGFHLGTTQWHPGEENYELISAAVRRARRLQLRL
jgi:hypothetical protein